MTLILALACSKPAALGQSTTVAPTGSVYLRSAFDADASPYVGRFVPQGVQAPDEAAAMTLACSRFISSRFVEGGGVTMTELMGVDTTVAARFGFPTASGSGNGGATKVARVEYTLTGKLVSEIADPAGFAACCQEQPDQCTDRYVGEFLQGTGAVYHEATSGLEAQAAGMAAAGGGDLAVSHGKTWQRAIQFPNPVYFAFRTTQTPQRQLTSSCGSWASSPPQVPGQLAYVGRASDQKTEDQARQKATRNAMNQAWMAYAAQAQPLDPETYDPAAATAAVDPVQAWAMSIQISESCVETAQTDKGTRYSATVLGVLPVPSFSP